MLELSSRLSRLYTYSKDTAFEAQENFTTEALAIAIADDPSPIIEALRRLDAEESARIGLLRCSQSATETPTIRSSTQVVLTGGGRLDLVLEILSERRTLVGSVWVEVKIAAPESGLQFDIYERHARKAGRPVWVVTLAHEPLRNWIRNLTWHELHRTVRHGRSQHRSWRDFLAFLEEQNVSNDALGPISDAEAASLEPAHQLAQKVSEVVKAVHRALPDLFGTVVGAKLKWKAEGELLNYVGATFRQTGDLWGGGKALRYGLTAHDGVAYWTIAVLPGATSREMTDAARKRIGEVGFGTEWEQPASRPSILTARTRATAVDSYEAAVDWFKTRLRELATSRVLDALLGFDQDFTEQRIMAEATQLLPSNIVSTEPRPPDEAPV